MLTISLTTTANRLEYCRICLSSLISQCSLPDRIVIWVSYEPYLRDSGFGNNDLLVKELEDIQKISNIIEIKWTANIGPYRKLIPLLRESTSEDIIVTADDDIFYGRNWLKLLLENYSEDELEVVASRVRLKKRNIFDREKSYIHWEIIKDNCTISKNAIITFGGGAVLKRSMFLESDINDENFLSIAPTTDDLWYSKLLERNGIKVRVCPDIISSLFFIEHDDGLVKNNFPKKTSFFLRIKDKLFNRKLGALGISVCNNDYSYKRIQSYFNRCKFDESVEIKNHLIK